MNQSTLKAGGFLIAALLLIAGGYLYQNNSASVSGTGDQTQTATTTNNPIFAPVTKSDTVGGSTNIIPITDNAPASVTYKAPVYPKTLVFSANASAAEKASLQKAYDVVLADIAKDRLDFNAWISVGTLNLMTGNTAMAKAVWEYASTQWPNNQVSHNNLGDLYMNYLKDYPKAEKEFLAAIAIKPEDTNPYRNLFTLYSDTSYKPTNTAAEDILKKGIAASPKSVDMQYLLATYYKKLGRTAEAKALYQAAIDNANSQGQTALAAQIKKELDALK